MQIKEILICHNNNNDDDVDWTDCELATQQPNKYNKECNITVGLEVDVDLHLVSGGRYGENDKSKCIGDNNFY